MKTSIQKLFLGSLLAAQLTGCMAQSSPGTVSAAEDALTVTPTHELPRSVWELAPAGCEDALPDGEYQILGAAGEPELRVVMSGSHAVCVDTLDALSTELHEVTNLRVDIALNETQVVFGSPSLLTRREEVSGDPSPQPNRPGWYAPGSGAAQGDPSPQPNAPPRPDASDPSPQPNQPGGHTAPQGAILQILAQWAGDYS